MIYGDKQLRKVITGTAANATARVSADLLGDGEVQAFYVDGTRVATAGENFKIFTNVGGVITSSDVIDPSNVLGSKTSDYDARQNQVSTITLAGTPVAGESWEATIRVRDYGMVSAYDYTNVYAQFIVPAAGATLAEVATGLANSFNQNIATHAGTIDITASTSTNDLVLTGNDTEWKEFQFDGRPLYFNASVTNPTVIAEVINPAVKIGVGEGTEMYNLEYFSKMVTGDQYANSEIKLVSPVLADVTKTYNVIEISYYSERQSAPGDKQRKVVTMPIDAGLALLSVAAQVTDPLQAIGLSLADVTVGI